MHDRTPSDLRAQHLAVIAVMALAPGPGAACAQSGGPYSLIKSTLDGGGVTFGEGGPYALSGTAGQPDAGILAGGAYSLEGGFWHSGGSPITEVGDQPPQDGPLSLRFYGSAPNPLQEGTTIAFDLPSPRHVELRLYSLAGALVSTLLDEIREAGRHRVIWNARDLAGHRVASGLYLLSFVAGDFRRTSKLVLLQ